MNASFLSPVDDTLNWLLESENPSVRYYALTGLLNKPESDYEVTNARRTIMEYGLVPGILALEHPDGYWTEAERFYTDKYKGTVWQLMILSELGADGSHPGIRKACEFILENSRDYESSAFAYRKKAKGLGGLHSEVIPCLTGNLLWSLIRLGFLNDSRVREGIWWICDKQRADDGIEKAPLGWPYDRYEMCWGQHSCHMGVVKTLKALAAIPIENRDILVREKIEFLSEFLLKHHIFKQSHNLGKVSKPGWKKFGFPLMYQTDILEIAEILTMLGYKDHRMQEGIGFIRSKQNTRGRWIMENSYNGRFHVDIESLGKESKWITLKAFMVLSKNGYLPD
jgi:hypothetical protein